MLGIGWRAGRQAGKPKPHSWGWGWGRTIVTASWGRAYLSSPVLGCLIIRAGFTGCLGHGQAEALQKATKVNRVGPPKCQQPCV